ncbi:MFS transporter [Acinetobacter rudis]|uniref:MFS transporter n=1 Tax=Acinetobacter rudis TaxID=632955 RepID=A0AAW8JAH8_9GAMM|nr:MFS transporter [Acinetobacter rudis]MDQ8935590.1 MFS transporter [Acinetobacter rudis]MDQ9017853.1 MFS transporter [Acinetobacter rudis]
MDIQKWDTSYEWKIVLLLTLGFGLVGLDRWIIAPLLPSIMKDLSLNYQHVGLIFGALGITWGIFSIFSGHLSDKIGHRKILLISLVIFSLASGFSGAAMGLSSLILIRALMGISEGAFCPTSFAATAVAAKPSRRGTLQGLQQSGFALFGLGLGPIIATQLMLILPSWREVFWVVAIPGFVLVIFLFFILREPEQTQGGKLLITERKATKQEKVNWSVILKTRNILLSMIGLFCTMSCVFVISAMVPLYLENYLKLNVQQMGFVVSAIGFGGFLGQFLVPAFSDWFGRRLSAVLSFLSSTIFIVLFANSAASISSLFILLFALSFFSLGLIALLSGPIAAESAPAGLVASSIGLVVGAGEIFGGGIAPVLSGLVADHYGIQNIFYLSLVGTVMGMIFSSFIKETAPRKIGAIHQKKIEEAKTVQSH